MMRIVIRLLFFASLFNIFPLANGRAMEKDSLNPEQVIYELYDLVTIRKGSTGDWESVRKLFIDEAVIVLRTSREGTTVFSLDGFIDDFVNFVANYNIKETGFTEKIISIKPWVFGDMAHVLVLYEASIPGSGRPPQQGVDSFLLIRKEGSWKVAAITNEIPTPERPVPDELLK
ncbi:MAG: hypothetical protein JSV24_10270 [Bacteroidales bacterium]|nr:MAG: hypothetical protein JSV24_10270 [Bacteroidales bacterium]